MNIGERVSLLREKFSKGNNIKFAELMGETPATTSNWCKAKSLGREVIVKILSKLPDVDANWLLMDKGEMIKSSSASSKSINNEVKGSFVGSNFVGGSNNGSIKTNVVSEPAAEYSSGKQSIKLEKENMKLKSENLILKAQLEERDRFIRMLLEKK